MSTNPKELNPLEASKAMIEKSKRSTDRTLRALQQDMEQENTLVQDTPNTRLQKVLKIWRERDAYSVSLRMYVVTVTGFSLWIAYGVLIGSWPVMGANSVCLLLSSIILILKWRFSGRRD